MAARETVPADGGPATGTFADLPHQLAAIVTLRRLPILQWDEGAGAVVGAKDLTNEEEEVEQTAFGQRRVNGILAVPLAKPIVLHMGMGDIRVGACAVRFERDGFVRSVILELVPAKLNPEAAELDVVQDQRLRVDGQEMLGGIDSETFELALNGDKVGMDLGNGREGFRGFLLWQVPLDPLEFSH